MYVENKCASCGSKFKGPNHYYYCRSCYLADSKFLESVFDDIDRSFSVPKEKEVVDVEECGKSESLKKCESSNLVETKNSLNDSSGTSSPDVNSILYPPFDMGKFMAESMKK